jgi:hypothetical protein
VYKKCYCVISVPRERFPPVTPTKIGVKNNRAALGLWLAAAGLMATLLVYRGVGIGRKEV